MLPPRRPSRLQRFSSTWALQSQQHGTPQRAAGGLADWEVPNAVVLGRSTPPLGWNRLPGFVAWAWQRGAPATQSKRRALDVNRGNISWEY